MEQRQEEEEDDVEGTKLRISYAIIKYMSNTYINIEINININIETHTNINITTDI